MTDRKPALKPYMDFENGDKVVLASDIPPAILNLTKAELAALAVFAEAMPELLNWPVEMPGHIYDKFRAAIKEAKL